MRTRNTTISVVTIASTLPTRLNPYGCVSSPIPRNDLTMLKYPPQSPPPPLLLLPPPPPLLACCLLPFAIVSVLSG